MQNFDTSLFLALTGSLQSPSWLVTLAAFLATWVVPLVVAGIAVTWIRAQNAWRPALLDAVAAGGLGLALVQAIGWAHYRPRPFEAGLGANLMQHLPENSFPSDHATLMFALAFGLLINRRLRMAGMMLLALALAVTWARVFLGAHYPSDILGGAVLALLCLCVIRALTIRLAVWTAVIRLYEAALVTLHLPQSLFPRGR